MPTGWAFSTNVDLVFVAFESVAAVLIASNGALKNKQIIKTNSTYSFLYIHITISERKDSTKCISLNQEISSLIMFPCNK